MIEWSPLPADRTALDGRRVLLAVASSDPEYPFTVHLGSWGADDGMFYTDSTDADGETVWLAPGDATFYAVVTMPGEEEFIAIPRLAD